MEVHDPMKPKLPICQRLVPSFYKAGLAFLPNTALSFDYLTHYRVFAVLPCHCDADLPQNSDSTSVRLAGPVIAGQMDFGITRGFNG